MKLKNTVLAAAALLSLATAAQAVEFGGYFRAGPGSKGANKCYGAPLEGGTYRLGNECNTYGEFQLSQGGKAGGVDYKATLMTNFFKPGSDIGDGKTEVKVNQIYAEGKGFDIAPNQTFWVGRRFYGRADVHMVDTFYVNMTGSGAGVDGIDLGGALLNLAVFRTSEFDDDNQPVDLRGTRLNADLQGLVTNPGGKLRITGTFTDFKGTEGTSGFGLSLQHNQQGVLGGENTLWLQYAQGSAYLSGNFGGGTDDSDMKRWRLIESITWVTGPLTGQAQLLVGKQGVKGEKEAFSSIGGRVAYAFTKNFKLQGELGFSRMKPDGGDAQQVTKFTIAPTLTVGPNYYDRPELRLYYTRGQWNEAYRLQNPQYGGDKSGNSFGIQVETWF
ncbi:MAG TPA: carbohydrate porin [Ideonella sp.]|nr:carbohydrate porin [Ideonella sp.]